MMKPEAEMFVRERLQEGVKLARKKKIPSIDYSIKLIVDQITSDLEGEIDKVASSVSKLNKRVGALERKVDKIRQEEKWAVLRSELGIGVGSRRRVSPERARRFILDRLREAEGDYVPSRELGGPLGIGRATVATRIKELADQGHDIVSSPRKGYSLRE
jgi:biotin operon repressor/polyhydroxyalkanoate synthesis regulator phasin